MIDVFHGDMTCCKMGHNNGTTPCDQEKLVKPMLGLLVELYRDRHDDAAIPTRATAASRPTRTSFLLSLYRAVDSLCPCGRSRAPSSRRAASEKDLPVLTLRTRPRRRPAPTCCSAGRASRRIERHPALTLKQTPRRGHGGDYLSRGSRRRGQISRTCRPLLFLPFLGRGSMGSSRGPRRALARASMSRTPRRRA